MKRLVFVLLCWMVAENSYSQNAVAGYYLTKNRDTVFGQIKVPQTIFGEDDFSKLFFKVEITDSSGRSAKYKPDDIPCFGFLHKGIRYVFFSKPTISQKNIRFLRPVVLGAKASLYEFHTENQYGSTVGTFYTFERADGSYTFLSTGIRNLSKFRETLKDFYKEETDVQLLIDKKFQSRIAIQTDIIEIVRAVNKS